MNVTVDVLTTHVQLANLYKFTKYDIHVTVRTRWDGPKSVTITVSTDEGSKLFGFSECNTFGMQYLKHERPCLTTFPNTEKRVENILTNLEVFGNVVKHCLECLIYLLNRN